MKIRINDRSIWVNYHHLYCFFVIARDGSMAKAAETLGIGTSALSIQLKQFEGTLNTKLFNRVQKRLVLSEAGRIVFSYAKEIFRLGKEMMESLHDQPKANRIQLQIGVLDTVPKHITLKLVSEALGFRDCSVSIAEGPLPFLFQQLSEHRIDLVITNSPPSPEYSNLFSKKIARQQLFALGVKKFLPLKAGFPESLNQVPVIMPTVESSVRHEIESYFKRHDIEPDYIAEAQDVMIQKLLALNGIGITVASDVAVREYLDSKQLYLLGKLAGAFEELFLVTSSRKIQNPVASEMMKSFNL